MDDLYDGPCEAGCKSFHGGEKKHHPDCGHYPESLTKLNADRIEELEAKLAECEARLEKAVVTLAWCARHEESEHARATLAELKGQNDE